MLRFFIGDSDSRKKCKNVSRCAPRETEMFGSCGVCVKEKRNRPEWRSVSGRAASEDARENVREVRRTAADLKREGRDVPDDKAGARSLAQASFTAKTARQDHHWGYRRGLRTQPDDLLLSFPGYL